MKILASTTLFLPTSWWYQLSTNQTLCSLNKLWADITLIASKQEWDSLTDKLLPYKVIRSAPHSYIWAIKCMFKTNQIYKKWKFDHVILLGHHTEIAYWLLLPFLSFKAVILAAWTRLSFDAPKWKKILWKIFLCMAYNKSKHIISISNQTKSLISSNCWCIDKLFSIVPRPIDNEIWWTNNPKTNNNIFTLLTVTRIEKQKNIDEVLTILQSLKNKGYKIKYILVWYWEYLEELKKQIKEKELDKIVNIIWRIDDVEILKNYYIESDIFILISRAHKSWNIFLWETFWRVYAESFSQATPVIWYNTWAVSEVIEHWVDWFLCEIWNLKKIESIIIDLINNPQKLKILGRKAREKYENVYNSDVVGKKLLDVLKNIKSYNE